LRVRFFVFLHWSRQSISAQLIRFFDSSFLASIGAVVSEVESHRFWSDSSGHFIFFQLFRRKAPNDSDPITRDATIPVTSFIA
jgi:hypothetical protein